MVTQLSSDGASYSSSCDTRSSDRSEMWNQIQRMPFEELEKTENFAYIRKVIELCNRYDFSPEDPHMNDKKYTMHVAQLLKLVCRRCLRELDAKDAKISFLSDRVEDLEAKTDVQFKEIVRLRSDEEKFMAFKSSNEKDDLVIISEVRRLKNENESLEIQIRKLSKRNEELTQSLQIRKENKDEVKDYNDKISLEFKHLVAKHNRLLEKSRITEDALEELRARENARKASEDSELARLREKVERLQIENSNLAQSRDRAEELCEQRESQALQDMANLRQLTKKIVHDEEKKFERLKVEFANYKQEKDNELDLLVSQHKNEIDEKEEEIKTLQNQIGKSHGNMNQDSDTSSSDSSRVSAVTRTVTAGPSGLDRLQRENYELSQEIEQLQIRVDASHEENSRLSRIIKDYESGTEGLRHLRHSLGDAIRTNELLQNENTQLRERLQGLEDSQTFIAALQELCRRIGVTDEEINSLKPASSQAYSEIDTLREELNVLKEEVEWLEKDRRHWMNKVRLQPLMDTKLRFELGLSAEQLKQLDHLVDQMKAGKVSLENDDENYRAKYYHELQLRRKDATQFNDYVKGRIDNAIQLALVGLQNGGNSNEVVTAFRDRVNGIFSFPTVELDTTVKQLRDQLESFTRRTEQCELSMKADAEQVAKLQDEVKAARIERDITGKECERYKSLVFSYLTNERNGEKPPSGVNEKWGDIASALREEIKVKDDVIEITNRKVKELQESAASLREGERSLQREVQVLNRTQENLNDQLVALRESNDELIKENSLLSKVNQDVSRGLELIKEEHSSTRELIQKIVLLRKREAFLIQRLRRTTAEKEDIQNSEHILSTSICATLKEVKNVLEGNSMGCILPPTATTFAAEQEMLQRLHEVVDFLTDGKLYRADSAYLIQLYNVYCSLDHGEELAELKLQHRKKQLELSVVQEKLDQALTDLQMRKDEKDIEISEEVSSLSHSGEPDSIDFLKASAKHWEMKATLWKQKHVLAAKRLEVKEKEVEILEADVSATMGEVVKVKEQIQNIFSPPALQTDVFSLPVSRSSDSSRVSKNQSVCGAKVGEFSTPRTDEKLATDNRSSIHQLEKEVARLRSINFSLLQHSLDMQSINKGLEIQLEGKKQEISLIRSSSDGSVMSEFIAAAIHEHTSLREQNEWTKIENKKLQLKLTAIEANLQVVSNEATSYKLGSYRLYRKYVDQIVKVVDYVRSIQRASEGALSAHRAEILDRRYARLVKELEAALEKSAELSTQCMIKENLVKTLEQQLTILREGTTKEVMEKVDETLREAQSKVREWTREKMEAKADAEHAQGKIDRLNEHIKLLNNELTRLEFGCIGVSPLDEAMLHNLLELKETVFSAAEAPPLAITLHSKGTEGELTQNSGNKDLTVLEEYKRAVTKQLELEKVCQELREELEKANDLRLRHSNEVKELEETVKGLEDHVAYCERQLQESKKNADDREARLMRAHHTQRDVSTRAVEHTMRCLQELLQKKDNSLQQLHLQLQAERQKLMELENREGARVEKLQEEFLRNNVAMIARFDAAINGATGEQVEQPVVIGPEGGSTAVLSERVRALTAQVLSLQHELSTARDLNISLESQLLSLVNQNIYQTQKPVKPDDLSSGMNFGAVSVETTGFPSGASLPSGASRETIPGSTSENLSRADVQARVAVRVEEAEGGTPQKAEDRGVTSTTGSPMDTLLKNDVLSSSPSPWLSGNTASVDAFSSIIRQQQTIINSVRLRESTLMQELSLERQRGEAVERELEHLRVQAVERGATILLNAPTQHVGLGARAPIEEELRAQISLMEQQATWAREELEREKMSHEQLRQEAQKWRDHLASVNDETAKQREEVEKAKQVVTMNTELHSTVNSIRAQNEKLVLAATILKQRLMEEAQRGGTTDRKLQQEVALVQRLGVIQDECTKQVKQLDIKVKILQKELEEKAVMEQQTLQQSEKCQKLIIQLQQQLREKEKQLTEIQQYNSRVSSSIIPASSTVPTPCEGGRSEHVPAEKDSSPSFPQERPSTLSPSLSPMEAGMHARQTFPSPLVGKTSGVQTDVLVPPHLANLMSQEVLRKERDHLQEISSLRSSLRRMETDLEETRLQLRAEREETRGMREQLQNLRRKNYEIEEQLARATARRYGKGRGSSGKGRSSSKSRSSSSPRQGREPSRGKKKGIAVNMDMAEANKKLRQRVAALEASLERREKESLINAPNRAPRTAAVANHSGDAGSNLSTKESSLAGPPADVRLFMSSILSLETVIDTLRKKINVDTSTKINELEVKLISQYRVIQELANEIAYLKNEPLTRVLEAFHINSSFGSCSSPTQLEEDLLRIKNSFAEVQYEREQLRVQVLRLQQSFQDVLAEKGLPTNFVPASEVTALHSLVDNLKVVLDSLLKENASLKGNTSIPASHSLAASSISDTKTREISLQQPLHDGIHPPVFSLTPRAAEDNASQGAFSDSLLEYHSSTARGVVNGVLPNPQESSIPSCVGRRSFPSLPPPLPVNPYSVRRSIQSTAPSSSTNSQRQSSSSSSSSTAAGSSSQRRLSSSAN